MKKSILVSWLLLIVLIIGLSNYHCRNASRTCEIEENLFVQVYCDVITYADLVDSKKREAFVDSVLNAHNVSREQFQHTIKIYSSDEKRWEKIFAKIVTELEKREKQLKTEGDSTHVITLKRNGTK